jgi:hypothetical protein
MRVYFVSLFVLIFSCVALPVSAAENEGPDNRFYRLFVPVTFYHSVVDSQLKLCDENSQQSIGNKEVDAVLMHLYLTRPDLVVNSDKQLQSSGTIKEEYVQPVRNEVAMVEKVAPVPVVLEAVDTVVVDIKKPNFWTCKFDGSLQFMQNYVSGNWYKGGESTYSAIGALSLEANYDNKSKWKWENKLEMKLGFLTSRSDSVHKFKSNEDLIRYTGKMGLQAANNWYYTLQVLAYTQFSRGFKANNLKTFSDFMSPFNFNVGLGMDYKVNWLKKKLTGTVNLSPLAVNYRYVARKGLASSFGVKTDRHTHSLTDFGSQLTTSLEWKMNETVSWKTRIYAFTSYHRAELEWENTFALHVSKYVSANLFLFPRFDDANKRDADLGYWQFKEYFSLGFNYSL